MALVENSPDRIPSIFKINLCRWYLCSLILLWTTGCLAVGGNGGQGMGESRQMQGKTNHTIEKYCISEHKLLNLI